jgi:hypothetical protein
MTTLAGCDGRALVGCRLLMRWTCTRRTRELADGQALERGACVVAVQPLDAQHAVIECWVESGGVRQLTILHSTTRPCALASSAEMMHLDVLAADGSGLLALSIHAADGSVAYVRSPLLREAGFLAGTYDPPTLQAMTDIRIAQSA